MFASVTTVGCMAIAVTAASAAALGSYNVDPNSISVSGLSSGGFMAAQLGVAYSDIFTKGFGVFAGGPYDCARDQYYTTCMYNGKPSISTPISNMKNWSGSKIADVNVLDQRRVYMWVGSSDSTVGPNVMDQLQSQLTNFVDSANISYVKTSGAAHTFPTDFNGSGDNSCSSATSPYISNCNYDGAGANLRWLHGTLNAKNTGSLSGSIVPFDQTGSYGASGMGTVGYLYVPQSCKSGSIVCSLHVALHGCQQYYGKIGSKFVENTGYNKWADTNNMIVLFPQAIADSSYHTVWNGGVLPNPNGCWDWVGWYGTDADQVGGVQMVAIINQVKKIASGYEGSSGSTSSTLSTSATTTSQITISTTKSTATTATSTSTGSLAPLYGQCGGIGWSGPTACASGVCTSYTSYYSQCLPSLN
ncbi:Alpha/Beta hydrolase protein [Aspergillus pseudodeflectus]|uniref:Alpha/Beta hydrolase protein n=1 Tax=Aspergillus pseudodeflectus TaxID=176178 RepID=A0ABR4JKS6_9EURO